MQDFPANSRKAIGEAAPKETPKPVTTAETVRRKRGLGHRFKATFFSGDARSSASYVIEDIIIPEIRDTIFNAIQGGIERLVYGEGPGKKRSSGGSGYSGLGHVAYNSMGKSPTAKTNAQRTLMRRARHDFDDLLIPTRREAEEVIDQMFDILSRYGQVSVADLHALTGVESAHTDLKWGWTALKGAKAAPVRQGGFLLDLPEPEPLG